MPDIGDLEGIKLPQPMALSHSGGSGFRAATIFECPRKAALKLLGWRVIFKPVALVFGSIIHKHAFKPYLSKAGRVEPESARDETQDMVNHEKYQDTYVGLDGKRRKVTQKVEVSDKNRLELPDLAERQMRVWAEKGYDPGTVKACERLMVWDLVDPETNEIPGEAEGVRVAGRLDLAIDTGEGYGIRDLKTAKSPLKATWIEDIGYSRQLSTYRYGWTVLTKTEPKDVGLFQLTKHKKLDTIREHAHELILNNPFTFKRVFDELMEAVSRLRVEEAAKKWPCNPHACVGKYSNCEFLPLCYSDQFDDPDEWKATLYRRDEG